MGFENLSKGSYVKFGQYEWLVLERKEDQALLVTRDAVGQHRFDGESNSWEDSELYEYLNKEFYNEAFTDEERKKIISTGLDEETCTPKGYVSLLSVEEAEKYFSCNAERLCRLQGKSCWYWLRSPGSTPLDITYVVASGSIFKEGSKPNDSDGAVRPVLRVKIDPVESVSIELKETQEKLKIANDEIERLRKNVDVLKACLTQLCKSVDVLRKEKTEIQKTISSI